MKMDKYFCLIVLLVKDKTFDGITFLRQIASDAE